MECLDPSDAKGPTIAQDLNLKANLLVDVSRPEEIAVEGVDTASLWECMHRRNQRLRQNLATENPAVGHPLCPAHKVSLCLPV